MFKVEKLAGKAVITVYGYVGGYFDYRYVAEALADISNAGYSNVDMHIHTNGGDVFEGNLIYNFISSFKGNVEIYIDGIAASMGAIIIMAAKTVHIAENGFIMIHNPSGGVNGTAKEHIEAAKLLRSIEKNFALKLSARTGKTLEQVNTELLDGLDHWIDADEAISLGLATDKFTATNGAVAFTKDEVVKMDIRQLYNSYTALSKETFNQPLSEMKQVNMKLKLKEDAPEPEAVAAIEALETTAANAIKERDEAKQKEAEATQKLTDKLSEIEQAQKATAAAESKALIDAAVKDGRLNDDAEHKAVGFWKKSFESDFEGAKSALAALPKHKGLAAELSASKAESAWDKRQKEIDESNKK